MRNLLFLILPFLASCGAKEDSDKINVTGLNLKNGDVILCGVGDKEYGAVDFGFTGSDKVKDDFNLALSMLHSFEYDEAEKVFAKIISKDRQCALAYWGVAMANYHQLWAPPTVEELEKGRKAVEIARNIEKKSAKETDFIEAIAEYYKDSQKTPHSERCSRFEKAMEGLYAKYPDDREAAIFFALALNGAADARDKTLSRQKKAGALLTRLYDKYPDHPGIVHYIIHSYDYPELAELGLPAAKIYAAIAPASAHAQHMPSHIFTRLGLWDEDVKCNLVAVSAAKCYGASMGIAGHWDEELHGLDYLTYAYLQKGDNENAMRQVEYLKTIEEVSPVNFKVAYAFASIPARYLLENRLWKDAANFEPHKANVDWKNFPWQRAIVHFTRGMGNLRSGNKNAAESELMKLKILRDTLISQKDEHKARLVNIQVLTLNAWLNYYKGVKKEAARQMNEAAVLEEGTQKHPVTPGEVLPAREMQGDLLFECGNYAEAFNAYKASLLTHPNRFNSLYGAAFSAERAGKIEEAQRYYRMFVADVNGGKSERDEVKKAQQFLKKKLVI